MFTPLSYQDATDHIARLHTQAERHRLLRRVETRLFGRRRGTRVGATSR